MSGWQWPGSGGTDRSDRWFDLIKRIGRVAIKTGAAAIAVTASLSFTAGAMASYAIPANTEREHAAALQARIQSGFSGWQMNLNLGTVETIDPNIIPANRWKVWLARLS